MHHCRSLKIKSQLTQSGAYQPTEGYFLSLFLSLFVFVVWCRFRPRARSWSSRFVLPRKMMEVAWAVAGCEKFHEEHDRCTVGRIIPHKSCSGKTTHLPGIKKRGIELKKCGIFRKLYSCRELTNVCPPETNGFPLDSGEDLQASGRKTSHLPGIKNRELN